MPFIIHCNSSSGVPFYRQIINQVIIAVAHNLLIPGSRLPTVRQLAVDLQINLNTVARAYKELEIRGIVTTQQGTGTFVSGILDTVSLEDREAQLQQSCETFLTELSSKGITLDEGIKVLKQIETGMITIGDGKEHHAEKN